MTTTLPLAVAGVGNNVSALVQGISLYRGLPDATPLIGVANEVIDGVSVTGIEFRLAFDVADTKVGRPLHQAVFCSPNNYPTIVEVPDTGVEVELGLNAHELQASEVHRISQRLVDAEVDVLLLSLPANTQDTGQAYARAALEAGVAVVNCSPDRIARQPDLLSLFEAAAVPLIGDDLASQLGSSLIHRTMLDLMRRRGVTVDGTYQINIGGNSDFENLRLHGDAKRESKLNVLAPSVEDATSLTVIPSGGYIAHLRDRKVAYINVEGRGWAQQPFTVQVRLEVQDSSNAAGVIVDLVRIAYSAHCEGVGGFPMQAASLLKSPPKTGREA